MKKQIKPFIAVAAGISLSALLCQTSQAGLAPGGSISGTSILADALGANTGPEALVINWSVSESLSDVYTYTYIVNNPAGDQLLGGPNVGSPEIVDDFAVDFNTTEPGALLPGTITGGTVGYPLAGAAVNWILFSPTVAAGTNSGPLSFESLDAPTMGIASAQDANPPSPWDSFPAGQPVPVPSVPDCGNTFALLGGAMTVLPFIGMRKKAFRS